MIEHVADDQAFVDTLKKRLQLGAYLLITTPNRRHRLFGDWQKPWNAFHVREYSVAQLNQLLLPYFERVEIMHIGSHSALIQKEINRTRKQRWVSLPSTLFFYPDALRAFLLQSHSRLYAFLRRLLKGSATKAADASKTHRLELTDVEDQIAIADDLPFYTDILAICKL